jgi:hypothetical protein
VAQSTHQFSLSLIEHEVNDSVISQRVSDGYINATALCQAAGSLWGHYAERRTTRDYMAALSADIGIPISELVQSVKGGNGPQGTWVHPEVAINLAMWLSPEFTVRVTRWVREWLSGKSPRPRSLPYHIERHMLNQSDIPMGYFSVLQEMTFLLIGPLDRLGYELPGRLVPDISMGRFLCEHLREQLQIDTDALPTYRHKYPDGRVVSAKLYPDEVLPLFRRLIQTEWLPKRAAKYFQERDPQALEFVDKVVRMLPSVKPMPPTPRVNRKSKGSEGGSPAFA